MVCPAVLVCLGGALWAALWLGWGGFGWDDGCGIGVRQTRMHELVEALHAEVVSHPTPSQKTRLTRTASQVQPSSFLAFIL